MVLTPLFNRYRRNPMNQYLDGEVNTKNINATHQLANLAKGYGDFVCEVGELSVKWSDVKRHDSRITRTLTSVSYAGQEYRSTKRFINSMSSYFCFGKSIFNLFTPAEVVERLQMVEPHTKIRISHFNNGLLAMGNPKKAYVNFHSLGSILARCEQTVDDLQYHDGVVSTTHKMEEEWDIYGDKFRQLFVVETPIDGYGTPTISLGLQRVSSGARLIASNKVFQSRVTMGGIGSFSAVPLMRAIDTFNNEEGFMAIKSRLENAKKSKASLNEVDSLHEAMSAANTSTQMTANWMTIMAKYTTMVGSIQSNYGLAAVGAISVKRARLLPMKCTVADLINFAIEVSSLSDATIDNRPINRWIGNMLCSEYDLEGVIDEVNVAPSMDNYINELKAAYDSCNF